MDACGLGSWQKSYKPLEISVTDRVTVFFPAVDDAAGALVALWHYFHPQHNVSGSGPN
jgi:hypothetical protein